MKTFSIIVAFCVIFVLGTCTYYAPVEVRYRLTAEVMAGGKIYAGTGVIASVFGNDPIPFSTRGSSYFRGEAVAVDVGELGTLFLLLAGRDKDGKPTSIAPGRRLLIPVLSPQLDQDTPGNNLDLGRALARMTPRKADVPMEHIPFLVRFRDINNPKSVEAVVPNNLAAQFGEGTRLMRVMIELTDDPVTTGIEKRLPWLSAMKSVALDGQRLRHFGKAETTANSLDYTNFKEGAQ